MAEMFNIHGNNALSKTFNSSWTVLWFCAVGTGWFGSTPGNIKLINFTKRTGRQTTKQADRRAASWMTTNHSNDEKRKLSLSHSLVMHKHTHSHIHTIITYTSAKNLQPGFFFFNPHRPHLSSWYFASPMRLANSTWQARTRRMIARAVLMLQDGGRTTVRVPWLVEAGGHLSPRANWLGGCSQEVQFGQSPLSRLDI